MGAQEREAAATSNGAAQRKSSGRGDANDSYDTSSPGRAVQSATPVVLQITTRPSPVLLSLSGSHDDQMTPTVGGRVPLSDTQKGQERRRQKARRSAAATKEGPRCGPKIFDDRTTTLRRSKGVARDRPITGKGSKSRQKWRGFETRKADLAAPLKLR